ncbi:Abi family protein [Acetobacteraceae bacterium]|nr:Abi family protein [Acetobacteraceae bacterium]
MEIYLVSVKSVLNLYEFDRKLRLHLAGALDIIEISLRGTIAYRFAMEHGSHGHLNPDNYTFKDNYKGDWKIVPIWAAIEVIPFGTLSVFLASIKSNEDKKAISHFYKLPALHLLPSITRHLAYTRNLCAHHSRLWNRHMRVPFTIPKFIMKQHCIKDENNQIIGDKKLYPTLLICDYLLKTIDPESQWSKKLNRLFAKHPHIDFQAMGFPTKREYASLSNPPINPYSEK